LAVLATALFMNQSVL